MNKLIVKSVYIDKDISLIPHCTNDRWYNIGNDINIIIEFDDLRWVTYNISKSFWFDGRSGGRIPDLFEPNIGSQRDLIDWLIHDINAYAQYFSYSDTNEILRQMRRMVVSRFRASYTKLAVTTSKSWFGVPKQNEREYINMIGNNGNKTFDIKIQYYRPKLDKYKLIKSI